jgi:chemotaxis signal transduction protein
MIDTFVVIELLHQRFAILAADVLEMVQMPPVTRVPTTPDYVRGATNLRGRVLPVVDLRSRLGLPTADAEVAEFVALLEAREQDHVRWLDELAACVEEGREFKLATDPHQCAFGKWYDGFRTDNRRLAFQLGQFDRPHRAIHAVAGEVLGLAMAGQQDRAERLLEDTRNGVLARLRTLFAEAREAVRETREVALVLRRSTDTIALAVDAVESVGPLDHETVAEAVPGAESIDTELIGGIARRRGQEDMILVLRTDQAL